jgi:hypothetical protein
MRSSRYVFLSVIPLFLVTACGPEIFTRTRIAWKPYAETERKQTKEGVIVEPKFTTQIPESFSATVQACNEAGQLRFDGCDRFTPTS